MGSNRSWDRLAKTEDGFCRRGFTKKQQEVERLRGAAKRVPGKHRYEVEDEMEELGLTASQLRVVMPEDE